ncbi:MAG: FAD-dependent oxidoreductase [Candidatus Liptonbacteria bacterium]|nr:FAD-dependent oxidoreductase [Candidatus Liptonbacteria bacterium]
MVLVDVVIVGAGVVGCSIALKLLETFPHVSVAVLERNESEFSEASRHNSGVVHSGVHQNPDFLKSKLARQGSTLLIEFCEREHVPHRKCGMVIAAARRDLAGLTSELKSLWLLYRNSRTQKIPIRLLSGKGIRKLEPRVRAALGIYLPEVWMVDQGELGRALRSAAEKGGARFFFGAEVKWITRRVSSYELETTQRKRYRARLVVNAAGVSSDAVSALAGFNGYKIFPYRGEYYEVVGPKKDLIRGTLVYPALPPKHPVKGIHLTKSMDGRLLVGPNAKPWKSTQDDFSVHTPPDEFLDGARRFLPSLTRDDLVWAYSGLRAKVNPGKGEDDFLVRFETPAFPMFVSLVGIESPGLTAGLALAEYVAEVIETKAHDSGFL